MTFINIIAYVALAILICVGIINPILMLLQLKKHKKSCWYRQIEPYRKPEFHIIPTISIDKSDGVEIKFMWLNYGIYTFYRMVTEDEDIAMDTAYWVTREENDKSK